MPHLYFEPSARLQRFLGRELISDPNLAIVEFVKNAYDGGAREVVVEFLLARRTKESQAITISDDGVGMTLDDFKQHWMHPGFSYKAGKQTARSTKRRTQAAERQANRVPVGEKGLGRLAAGRLGEHMEVFTRPSANDPWLHVSVDWADFDDMSQALNKVPIAYELLNDWDEGRFSTGTIVKIRNLSLDWSGMVPGRKVAGRSDLRIGRLRQDLEILVAPLATPSPTDFQVVLEADQPVKNFLGPVTRDQPAFIDYVYEFAVSERAGKVVIGRQVRRSAEIAERVEQPERTSLAPLRLAPEEKLQSGPFKGTLYYVPLSSRRWRELGYPMGVHLYRDGVRVDPYGHGEDDWLGARARKAARQGYAAIQPNHLAGFVLISRGANPELVDMSNRQGLVENEGSLNFLRYARLAFSDFEELVFEEFVKPGWESPEEKLRQGAERSQRYSNAMLRSLVHSIRQQVSGLGAEMTSVRQIADDPGTPAALAEELRGIHTRSTRHIGDIDSALARYFGGAPEEAVTTFDLRHALAEAVDVVQPLVESFDVTMCVSRIASAVRS